MAYGQGKDKEDFDYRAIALSVGKLTDSKKGSLAYLRDCMLVVLNELGKLAFTQEPLIAVPTKKSLDQRLSAAHDSFTGFNKAYVQKASITVLAAASEHNKRYFAQLFGRLAHCADETPAAERKPQKDGSPARKYFYVPVDIQDVVDKRDLLALQAYTDAPAEGAEAPSPARYIALFKRVILDNNTKGLNVHQVAVIREIHRKVQERHRPMDFGGENTTVQIPLDYRMLPQDVDAVDMPALLEEQAEALMLTDGKNAQYKFFLAVANATPRDERIAIPLALRKNQIERLTIENSNRDKRKAFTANSLTLELGPNGLVEVKLIVTQPTPKQRPLNDYPYLIARDFGYANTVTLSVFKREEAIEAKRLAEIQSFTKAQALKYLTTHIAAKEPDPVFRLRIQGRGFLKRINNLCLKIDAYQTRIQEEYVSLEAQKEFLATEFGLVKDECGDWPWLERGQVPKGHRLYPALKKFFATMDLIKSLKTARTRVYKKVAAVKKCWFGFVANIELELARGYDALVVRENLTVEAIQKDAPKYKGRAYNKMINNGAHGQYERAATNKFLWNGVSEVTLPSYYTSTTCVQHAYVNAAMRAGEVFSCPHCLSEGKPKEHADEHASDTLGQYLFLRPKKLVTNTPPA